MYECVQVGENTFFMDCPSRVGIYRDGGAAWLIDSGSDKDAAKKVLKILDDLGLRLEAAIVTHYHADHTGGAALLQQRTNCRLYLTAPTAPGDFPEINTALLFGAHPPKPLRTKFFLAQSARYEPAETAPLSEGMRLVRLDGHALAQLGVCTPDDVWFLGDAVASEHTFDKYKLTYLYDVEKFLATLDTVASLRGKCFIPAHVAPFEDTASIVERNRRWVYETGDCIVELLRAPMTFEALLKAIFDRYDLQMTFGQHTLLGATVRAFLTWLMDAGRVSYFCEDNLLYWKAAEAGEGQ